jgi:hypothetical protein
MYERLQIESLLQMTGTKIARDTGLFLMPDTVHFKYIADAAVLPAMQKAGLDVRHLEMSFDSGALLTEIGNAVCSAEVIVADVSTPNADLMYVLGICHGLGRCPILLAEQETALPFNLGALRVVEYSMGPMGMHQLRDSLSRAIRTFLAAARAGEQR